MHPQVKINKITKNYVDESYCWKCFDTVIFVLRMVELVHKLEVGAT